MFTLVPMADPRAQESLSSKTPMMLDTLFSSLMAMIGRVEFWRSERTDLLVVVELVVELAPAPAAWASAAVVALEGVCAAASAVASAAVVDLAVDVVVSASEVAAASLLLRVPASRLLPLHALSPRTPSPTLPVPVLREARPSMSAT